MQIPGIVKATAGTAGTFALTSLGIALAAQQSTTPHVEGVWRVVEVTTTGPGGTTDRNPQPGLYFFMGK